MTKKLGFYLLWLLLLALVPATILRQLNIHNILTSHAAMANLIQRFLGLTIYILLFWQIMLGAYMQKWTEKLGGWVLRFHITEGVLIYLLILLHPLMFAFFRYFSGLGLDPIFVYFGYCLYCSTILDFYYTLGRVALLLITVGVLAGLFRTSTPFMRVNWRKFHVVNYVVFLIAGIHGLSLGTDFRTMPFFAFAIVAYLLVLYTIGRKLPALLTSYKTWLQN